MRIELISSNVSIPLSLGPGPPRSCTFHWSFSTFSNAPTPGRVYFSGSIHLLQLNCRSEPQHPSIPLLPQETKSNNSASEARISKRTAKFWRLFGLLSFSMLVRTRLILTRGSGSTSNVFSRSSETLTRPSLELVVERGPPPHSLFQNYLYNFTCKALKHPVRMFDLGPPGRDSIVEAPIHAKSES
jgi:hypothetical protein